MSGDLRADQDKRSAKKKRRKASAVSRRRSKPVESNPNYEGINGGTLEDCRFYRRDIYGELEKIEERGKKKRKWLSLFGERDKT